MKIRSLITAVSAMLFAFAAGSVHAQQAYPYKPIRLIVPFPAGGQTDVVARTVALKLAEVFGQQVVVDNRPGAAGSIGVELGLNSNPDGYTMIQISTSYAGNVALYKLKYDPIRDVTPVGMIGEIANMVTVHPSGPYQNVRELIAYAKANPGKINFASGGIGSGNHLATEEFAQMTGIRMTHVPYKGSTAGVTDLVNGQIQLIFSGITGMIAHHKAKRVRGVAVTSAKRNPAVPDLPTVGETVPGYVSVSWSAILAPKGVPGAVVARWSKDLNRVLQMPDVKARMDSIGLELVGGTPEQFRDILVKDIAKWKKVVKTANIKL